MSNNVDENWVRNKLAQLQGKGKGFSKNQENTWKPKQLPQGETVGEKSTIRLVKYPYGEDPFIELWFHYGIPGGQPPLCLKLNYGKTCPVCEFGKQLASTGNPQDKEWGKKMFATQRNFAVVVDREDPEMKPKYWGFGKKVYIALVQYLGDEDYSNYLDPVEGLDLVVNYEKSEGQSYPNTVIKFKRKECPLADSPEKIEKVMESIKPIEEIYKPMTKSEIQERLEKWIDSNDDEVSESPSNGSSELVKGGNNDEEEKESVNVQDVDELFEHALSS